MYAKPTRGGAAAAVALSRPLGILARGVVRVDAVQRHLFELPLRILVEGADADVADPLAVHTFGAAQGGVRKVAGGGYLDNSGVRRLTSGWGRPQPDASTMQRV